MADYYALGHSSEQVARLYVTTSEFVLFVSGICHQHSFISCLSLLSKVRYLCPIHPHISLKVYFFIAKETINSEINPMLLIRAYSQ